MAQTIDPFRSGKTYTVAEAARLARTSPQNVRRWLLGYKVPGHRMEPVFGEREALRLSFLELAEIVVVARFRERKSVRLQTLRDAHAYVRHTWSEIEYPFASLKLKEFGGQVLHDFDTRVPHLGAALAISMRGQWVLPTMVAEALDLFEFEENDKLAARWFPLGQDAPIVVDPRFAGGRPVIRGSGVTVDIVRKRFFDGDQTIGFIARDLRLERDDVEEVIRYARAA